ncbi:MAG TPA: NAD(P)H-binding protein [Steroidobacteraceae bacterium]|nr:NAD(P)H-binding protein [Steroidobacteraceae bacterium]
MSNGTTKVALLAGASGLTGGYVLDALLEAPDFSRVIAVTRRPLPREHARLANRIVQFDRMEAQLQGVTADVALCCLGTTIARAGSRESFREVDVDYVLAFARTALAARAQRFVVMSSAGADPRSRNFYLRTKGEMEEELEAVGFPALDILQPGLLLGWRHETRPLELAAAAFMPLVNPFLVGKRAAWRAISARTVAAAMVGATRSGRKGVQRHVNPGIQALARLTPPRGPAAPPDRKPARAR